MFSRFFSGISSKYFHKPPFRCSMLCLVKISLRPSRSKDMSILPPHPSLGGTSLSVYSFPHLAHLSCLILDTAAPAFNACQASVMIVMETPIDLFPRHSAVLTYTMIGVWF